MYTCDYSDRADGSSKCNGHAHCNMLFDYAEVYCHPTYMHGSFVFLCNMSTCNMIIPSGLGTRQFECMHVFLNLNAQRIIAESNFN